MYFLNLFVLSTGFPLVVVGGSAIYNIDGYGYPVFAFMEDSETKIVETYR